MLFLLNMAEGHDFCIAKLAQCSLSDSSELKSTHQNGLPGPGLVPQKDCCRISSETKGTTFDRSPTPDHLQMQSETRKLNFVTEIIENCVL